MQIHQQMRNIHVRMCSWSIPTPFGFDGIPSIDGRNLIGRRLEVGGPLGVRGSARTEETSGG
jgi:hypothetical protein